MTLYLDYVGHGIWALSDNIQFARPRRYQCRNPVRLLQEFGDKNIIMMSEMAEFICDNILSETSWLKQWALTFKNPHPDCHINN